MKPLAIEGIPPAVLAAVGSVSAVENVTGGMSRLTRITAGDGRQFALKTNDAALPGMFVTEADSLRRLGAVAGGPAVAKVVSVGEDHLLLPWLGELPPADSAPEWREFGVRLATLHAQTDARFGWHCQNYWGLFTQDNTRDADGARFHLERRLLPYLRHEVVRRVVPGEVLAACERVAERWGELFLPGRPALVHGDLWLANLRGGGGVTMIDPSAHYGWAEWDLAMLGMWSGGPPAAFYEAYVHHARPADGWRERAALLRMIPEMAMVVITGDMAQAPQLAGLVRAWM